MNIAILTFEGFNELDSFIAAGILNRMKSNGWNVQITCPSDTVTSMNGVTIKAQQPLEFANTADVVVFGSGIYTRDIAQDNKILDRLKLDPSKQLICAQCSGALLLSVLGLLNNLPACTDLTTKPWVIESGVEVLNQPFFAKNNIATAGGCMSSSYLATWIIAKLAGNESAESAIHYVAPVGEKESAVAHSMSVVSPFIE
ncbi:DJ-1/PfpI family protein [Oceanospirillaceae bacterium]|jgi:transcriptional regulator GlxA family with amidase domain|uniref:DJ-1/PfpI family protein n=1 Tax=Candidatus Njordibacter sp. Uisw_002 TaxID=3230971 RepID=UPI00233B5BD9|nr:DJ-1/PfpI family protein [Oceanospirillaceae bacterium]|tara:strand:+ start:362 stop:961 length:600 start_codon:yes stop_codon:yes gene_type:complete